MSIQKSTGKVLVHTHGFFTGNEQTGSSLKRLFSVKKDQSVPLVQSVHNIQSVIPIQSVISATHTPVMSITTTLTTPITNTLVNTHVTNTPTFVSPITNKTNKRVFRVKPFQVKSHRRGKRQSVRPFAKTFSWLGNNIAGASSKWASVKRWVRTKAPVILSLQETKFQAAGKHKLDGYITYEHLRKEKKLLEVDFYWQ